MSSLPVSVLLSLLGGTDLKNKVSNNKKIYFLERKILTFIGAVIYMLFLIIVFYLLLSSCLL